MLYYTTLPKTNLAPESMPSQRKLVFQPSILSCYVCFREGNSLPIYERVGTISTVILSN